MRRWFLSVAVLAAIAACGGRADAGVAPGKGAPPPTGVAVTTPVEAAPADATPTPAQVEAVADNVFPLIQPFGYYGACGLDGNLATCPYTERLKSRLGQLRETLMRSQNPSATRQVETRVTPDGSIARVTLFGGREVVDLVVVREPDGSLLVDDETCAGRPETSIYSAFSACR